MVYEAVKPWRNQILLKQRPATARPSNFDELPGNFLGCDERPLIP